MRKIFADTNYWVALLNPKDGLHNKAKNKITSLGNIYIITSEMVLTEVLNAFSGKEKKIRMAAVKLVETLDQNPNVKVFPQTSIQFKEALFLYSSRKDKKWGLTDCSSINILEKEKIGEALSHDKHFEQAGFTALLKE